MKRLLFTILCLPIFLIHTINARQRITGTVLDNDKTPLEFANVVLSNSNNHNIIDGVIINSEGVFKIALDNSLTPSNDKYTLSISFIRYTDWTTTISSNTSLDLGEIRLPDALELDGVLITANRPIISKIQCSFIIKQLKNTTKIGVR